VTVDTLRYYERLVVLPRARRTTGGLREYGDDVLRHLRFVQRGKRSATLRRNVAHGLGPTVIALGVQPARWSSTEAGIFVYRARSRS
jgi:hypothetical protein